MRLKTLSSAMNAAYYQLGFKQLPLEYTYDSRGGAHVEFIRPNATVNPQIVFPDVDKTESKMYVKYESIGDIPVSNPHLKYYVDNSFGETCGYHHVQLKTGEIAHVSYKLDLETGVLTFDESKGRSVEKQGFVSLTTRKYRDPGMMRVP